MFKPRFRVSFSYSPECQQISDLDTTDIAENPESAELNVQEAVTNEATKRKNISFSDSRVNYFEASSWYEQKSTSENLKKDDAFELIVDISSVCSEESLGGTWGSFGIDNNPWMDKKRPIVKIRTYSDLVLNEMEQEGILTDRIMSTCSSYLDRCPDKNKYVATKVTLVDKALVDIRIISFHHYLQYVDLSHNKLSDITPLGGCPFLMYLDVSHNCLESVLPFKAPWNLTYVNYSHNYVTQIGDLSDFWSIIYLDLSYNKITKIEGLKNLRYLKTLILYMNNIRCIENLSDLQIKLLDIRYNKLDSAEKGLAVGFRTMYSMEILLLSFNHLPTLEFLQGATTLKKIDVSQNNISSLMDISYLAGMIYLNELDLTYNPIMEWKRLKDFILFSLPSINFLNASPVGIEEKIAAQCWFSPANWLLVATQQAKLMLLEQLHKPNITSAIVPADQGPRPLIALVGPQGSNKAAIVKKLVQKLPEYVQRGICYTTRPMEDNEIDGQDYYFTSFEEFHEMTKKGEFIALTEYLGHHYGLSLSELEKSADEHKICVFHFNIVTAFELNIRWLCPVMVLAMPRTEESHREILTNKYESLYSNILNGPIDIRKYVQEDLNFVYSESPFYDYLTYFNRKAHGCGEQCHCSELNNPANIKVKSESSSTCTSSQSDESGNPKRNSKVSTDQNDSKLNEDLENLHWLECAPESESVELVLDYEESLVDMKLNPDITLKYFIQSVINTREVYLNLHHTSPELFPWTIYTDEEDSAVEKLTYIVKQVARDQYNFPLLNYQKDNVYTSMVTKRIERITQKLKK